MTLKDSFFAPYVLALLFAMLRFLTWFMPEAYNRPEGLPKVSANPTCAVSLASGPLALKSALFEAICDQLLAREHQALQQGPAPQPPSRQA